MRYFVELSFRGTRYHGWQLQPNAHSVQAEVEKALSSVIGEPVNVTGAGRTDTGVHARYFAAHFDSESDLVLQKPVLLYHVNCILPGDIHVTDIFCVRPDAHARFSAVSRTYSYSIATRKDPFDGGLAWHFHRLLNVDAMNRASEILFSYTDFSSFCKLHGGNSTNICHIYKAEWVRLEGRLVFTIMADRFLRSMVRSIVGTIVEVGLEKLAPGELKNILEKRDRKAAGFSVPAEGLMLTDIKYPEDIRLIHPGK